MLLVEDEPRMSSLISAHLERGGVVVDVAADAAGALSTARRFAYEVMIVDWCLPDGDGLTFCREVRDWSEATRLIMITANGATTDRVRALDAGVDDLLTKPFELIELSARLRAVLRRGASAPGLIYEAGGLRIDPSRHLVSRDGVPIDLTSRQLTLLVELVRHRGQVVSRDWLLEHVWDFAAEYGSNVVDAEIRRLRLRVDGPFDGHLIETVRGRGYRFRAT